MTRKSDMSPEAWQRHLEANAAWRRNNPDKVRTYAHRYDTSPKKKLANQKYVEQRRDENPEGWLQVQRDAAMRSYQKRKARDPEALAAWNRERQKRQREKDPEKGRARSRQQYRTKHPLPDKSGRDLFAILQKGIPRTIPDHIRDDVLGEMALGLSDGRIKLGSIGLEIRRFITAQYRNQDYHRVLSLDSPLPGKEGQTWVDALESDVEHF